jgi:hypothetical protein
MQLTSWPESFNDFVLMAPLLPTGQSRNTMRFDKQAFIWHTSVGNMVIRNMNSPQQLWD